MNTPFRRNHQMGSLFSQPSAGSERALVMAFIYVYWDDSIFVKSIAVDKEGEESCNNIRYVQV